MKLDKPTYQVVACKRCGAQIGVRCYGTTRNAHGERITDAYRLKARTAGRLARAAGKSNDEFRAAHDQLDETQLLAEIAETDGAEILRPSWPLAEQLASRGLITLGPARGPGGHWRRAEIVEKLSQLTEGLGVEGPVSGVEPAAAFAKRLAQKLCIFGDPPVGLVIEILKAVRERDAAIVKAKDDEAYAVSMRAASRSTR